MEDEIGALYKNEAFEYMKLPAGTTLIGGKWVYTVKIDSEGEERYKARYVAKGFSRSQMLITRKCSVQVPELYPFACCYR